MARARAALAAWSVVTFAVACQPQDVYLFDGPPATTRVDAGSSQPEPTPEPPSMDPPVAAPVDAGAQLEAPPCASPACDACVAREACSVAAATLFCHPSTARCSLPCDPDAPARMPGNCPLTERCDPRIGLCVECVADEDCGGASAVCETTSGTCVECNADLDCAASGGLCLREEHRCVQCRVDADCLVGDDRNVCLPGLLRCGECLVDADCTGADEPFCSTENECKDERE